MINFFFACAIVTIPLAQRNVLQIESVQWTGGQSNIAAALRTVRCHVLGTTANRPEAEDVIVVMIGGWLV